MDKQVNYYYDDALKDFFEIMVWVSARVKYLKKKNMWCTTSCQCVSVLRQETGVVLFMFQT